MDEESLPPASAVRPIRWVQGVYALHTFVGLLALCFGLVCVFGIKSIPVRISGVILSAAAIWEVGAAHGLRMELQSGTGQVRGLALQAGLAAGIVLVTAAMPWLIGHWELRTSNDLFLLGGLLAFITLPIMLTFVVVRLCQGGWLGGYKVPVRNVPGWIVAGVLLLTVAGIAWRIFFTPGWCVVRGTLVDTPTGPVAVQHLRVGDAISTRAPDGRVVSGTITATNAAEVACHLRVRLANGQELRLTDPHPVLVKRRWVRADALCVADRVTIREGTSAITAITRVFGSVTVYDLSVTPNENFVANGVVVHNKRTRIGHNESSAIGSLRSMSTAQTMFQNRGLIDVDGDGVGEFGFLGELSGNVPCRGGKQLDPDDIFIAAILGVRDANGVSQKSGYYFRVFLPGKTSVVTESNGTNGEPSNPAHADAQERRWICYAWPVERGKTGNRAFVVTHAGDVYASPNKKAMYSGLKVTPAPDAALDGAGKAPRNLESGIGLPAAGLTSSDGGIWVPAGA